VSDTVRTLGIGFRWERLAAPVEVRFKAGGEGAVEAAGRKGRRLDPDERVKVLRFSFQDVRRSIEADPGIYLVEAFQAGSRPAFDFGPTPREVRGDILADEAELAADPSWEDEPQEREPLWFYIGMSGNLKERFRGHEGGSSPLMRKLNDYLGGEDTSLRVSLQRGQSISHADGPRSVDLGSKVIRTLFEDAAIADYRHCNPGMPMVNTDGSRRPEAGASPPPELDDFAGLDHLREGEIPF
jgi:hypothetical protein